MVSPGEPPANWRGEAAPPGQDLWNQKEGSPSPAEKTSFSPHEEEEFKREKRNLGNAHRL